MTFIDTRKAMPMVYFTETRTKLVLSQILILVYPWNLLLTASDRILFGFLPLYISTDCLAWKKYLFLNLGLWT